MKTGEIAKFLGGKLCGDADVEISGVADLKSAGAGQIAYFDGREPISETQAACLITKEAGSEGHSRPTISVAEPKLAFARIAAVLHKRETPGGEIHQSAVVSSFAKLGTGVSFGAFAFIGDGSIIGAGTEVGHGTKIGKNVSIGQNCVLHANVVIEDDCVLGDRVILHAGVVIGADGFGYVRGGESYVKFPQIGRVVIENDVEIGANSCIDRGALGDTTIGAGTKIDNLVQIAHNVQIGRRVIIAAQTGISGSTVIEDDCVIGGQVGMGDHARVQSGAVIGSQAGVLPGKIVRPGVWWGTPVRPLDEFKRRNAQLNGIERLKKQVTELKAEIGKLKGEAKPDR